MATEDRESNVAADKPLPQRILERPWLLAVAAILFWALSYIVWGLIEITTLEGG